MTDSFEKLKETLCKEVVVHIPDFAVPFILQTDASDNSLGTVLLQHKEGEKCPVTLASHKLSSAEAKYVTIEKECLAIHWATEHFRYYLLGQDFMVIMDHAPCND